ncbi:TA system antitoxin ParD family protein [Aquabacterium sp.]|uniref:TA system antitoxin ParD family protein n=1 Tax=Aquabacterium sp. TaxID=1872578 RepID=UPI002B606941|nr:hypothetical protein [Aquabacterium sp.]HSW04736.1 hypothetical protein [Aquabacterium sp.]
MSSNSLRISSDLFEQALAHGQLMSRSAAQQLEHWARLGAAAEASGLTVPQLQALLKGELTGHAVRAQAEASVASAPEAQLRAHKRAQQQRDIASIAAGHSSNEAMSWFSASRARRAKAINSPL